MTEAEWMACGDPAKALAALQEQTSDRKLRLFACACGHYVWTLLTDERSRCAIWAAERYADSEVEEEELAEARAAALKAGWENANNVAVSATEMISGAAATLAIYYTSCAKAAHVDVPFATANEARDAARRQLIPFFRDIFGNPFRPITFNPAWRSSDVMLLARAIYDEKAFDRMSILADALQDSGCENEGILNHCRDASLTHVRGCWVIDLILGQE
jgi:hypothetical protein